MKKLLLLLLSSIVLFQFACRKDSFITGGDALIRLSSDTLFFDTVFTSTGSVTEAVRIINTNDQKLRLTDVKLMGGAASPFSINVDGYAGPERGNLELEAGDSVYIFVAVRVNPTSAGLPFILQDSIAVQFNGKQEFIQLQAYGQNAHFLRNQVITGNTVWDRTLPYVILGGLQIDTGAVLAIPAGCRVYFHAGAPMLVDGSLQVTGDHFDSTRVYFLGDRLDDPYRNFPGSWPGIYFRETSSDSHLSYAVIKNAYQAVVAESPPIGNQAKLILDQCIIDNSSDAGIMGIQGNLLANNCLISNCGKNIELGGGGIYQFTNCTAASYSNIYLPHTQPVLSLSDVYTQGGGSAAGDVEAIFTNCIFWGSNGTVNDEVSVSRQSTGIFSVSFTNCLWKVETAPANVTATGMITNMDPLFDSVNNSKVFYDFHLKAGSPAIDKGVTTSLLVDLDGNPRVVVSPDLGSYERQ
ncbi:MAG TPA: choice-of-anchor Q domain-containing protein [Puia sp.]|jgi:hypothetical protein